MRGLIFDLDVSYSMPKRYICACGKDKILNIIDPFKWQIHTFFKSATKYELIGCKYSLVDNKHVYCFGMDKDIMCHQWKQFSKHKNTHGNKKSTTPKQSRVKGSKSMNKERKKQMNASQSTSTNVSRFQHCFRGDASWIGADLVADGSSETMIGILSLPCDLLVFKEIVCMF